MLGVFVKSFLESDLKEHKDTKSYEHVQRGRMLRNTRMLRSTVLAVTQMP